jgi:hypothetical protein
MRKAETLPVQLQIQGFSRRTNRLRVIQLPGPPLSGRYPARFGKQAPVQVGIRRPLGWRVANNFRVFRPGMRYT